MRSESKDNWIYIVLGSKVPDGNTRPPRYQEGRGRERIVPEMESTDEKGDLRGRKCFENSQRGTTLGVKT